MKTNAPHDSASARSFALAWATHWNRRDVDAVLAHFAPGVIFTSQKAVAITGSGRLDGKDALSAYWRAALERIPSIQFDVDGALWDTASSTISILYRAGLNGGVVKACEVLRFDATGHVVQGDAYYGAPLADDAAARSA